MMKIPIPLFLLPHKGKTYHKRWGGGTKRKEKNNKMSGVPVLVTSPGMYSLPAVQPYCIAAETLLRMAHVDFDKNEDETAKVVPRVHEGTDPVRSPEEGFASVCQRLVPARSSISKNDAALSPENALLSRAFTTLCAEKLGQVHTYVISGEDSAWV